MNEKKGTLIKNNIPRVFIAPRSGEQSTKNFKKTIDGGYRKSELESFLTAQDKLSLKDTDTLLIWGNKPSLKSRWDKMQENDWVLFYQEGRITYAGKLLYKAHNKLLADKLWGQQKDKGGEPVSWEYVFFLKELREVDKSYSTMAELAGYKGGAVQGFLPYSQVGVEQIISKYESIENFLGIGDTSETISNKNNLIDEDQPTSKYEKKVEEMVVNSDNESGSILDFKLVKKYVDTYVKEYGGKESSAFLAIVLQNYLKLDQDEIEEAIIDAGYDCGIDAIYIDENDDNGIPRVYLFQSKYYLSAEKYNRSFEGGAIDKMINAIESLILYPDSNRSYTNSKLSDKLNDIKNLGHHSIEIVFCSNSAHPDIRAKDKLNDYLDRKDRGQNYFSATYIGLFEIAKALAPKKRAILSGSIRLSGKYLNWDSGLARTIVGRVSGKTLADLRDNYGDELFDKNVRGYLSQTNAVNRKIKDTASGNNSHDFFYLNNGVTLVCKKFKYVPEDESPNVELEDFQIVNGGQTTNAIYEAYLNGTLSDKVNVLIKIIESSDSSLLDRITEATNNQTLVNERDLKSNEDIQKTLEAYLLKLGYYYESRKDKFKDVASKEKRIDAVKAAQAYFAFHNQRPADAKNKKRQLFGTLYNEIFNQNLDPETLLKSFLLYQEILKLNKTNRDKYSFINYADYHILAVLNDESIKFNNFKDIKKPYAKIVKATNTVVQKEMEEKKDTYSHRALFIDPATLGKIEEVLETQKN